jgi:hypothetical protein
MASLQCPAAGQDALCHANGGREGTGLRDPRLALNSLVPTRQAATCPLTRIWRSGAIGVLNPGRYRYSCAKKAVTLGSTSHESSGPWGGRSSGAPISGSIVIAQ